MAALHLPALAAQLPLLAAMFVVCAFGSCLDVAAIQADMEEPIDFDAELSTAGKRVSRGCRLHRVRILPSSAVSEGPPHRARTAFVRKFACGPVCVSLICTILQRTRSDT